MEIEYLYAVTQGMPLHDMTDCGDKKAAAHMNAAAININ